MANGRAPGWDEVALATLAEETGCESVDVESPGKIVALLTVCLVMCVACVIGLTVLHRWWFVCRPRRQDLVEEIQRKTDRKQGLQSPRRGFRVSDYADLDPTPNLAMAKEHLKRTSPTDKNNNWRSLWGTSIKEIGLMGGPGLGLYFTILVYLGLCFTYAWVFSIPLTVFTVLGDFAPQGTGVFPQITIANLGTESTAGVPQENRLVVMGCQGMAVSSLTRYFGWLDFIGTVMFTGCAVWLCFFKVPHADKELDATALQASDYSLEVNNLPRRIGNHANYEEVLKSHILKRIQAARMNQANFYKKSTPPMQVCAVVLVRDQGMELGRKKERAQLMMQKDIEQYKGNSDKAAKLQEKIDKISSKVKGQEDADLDVLRAFVTLNASDDVTALLYQYRFARFWIFRQSQNEALRFEGTPIRMQRAPEPSNIFWENQDVPWRSRMCRRIVVTLICVAIVLICLGLMFLTTKQAQKAVSKYETSAAPGHVSCTATRYATTPAPPSCASDGWDIRQDGGSWVLVDSAGALVPDQTQDTMDCWCAAQGPSRVAQDADSREACHDLLVAYGTRLAITILSALIVVVINVAMAGFLMVVAEKELPLSISELNNAQMTKVFLSQFLNTALVVFAVHYESIDDFQRGWYVVVGVAVCMTMTTNTVINAICYFLFWGIAVLRRMCTGIEGKHQAEILDIYTNPPWDMASRYAYLLMTVYVTVVYSSGMPILNFLAILYCIISYWSDKACLLWGSAQPPQYDAKMPKRTAWWLIFAGALHCLAAIAQYGHPCVFPSNPLGGALGHLTDQALQEARTAADVQGNIPNADIAGTASTFFDRLGRDTTWMFGLMFFAMLVMGFLYIFLKAVGSTCGELCAMLKVACCPSRIKVVPEGLTGVPWDKAAIEIEQERPPASYKMEDHPDFKRFAKYTVGG